MGHAYTPGLKVTPRITHQVRRILPIKGQVLVELGQTVQADDVVAETFMQGDATPVNISNQLSLPPGDVIDCMLKEKGDTVEVGDVIARTKGIFGMFKSDCRAKVAGTLETVSSVTGQVIIRGKPLPVLVKAYMAGKVVKIIENEGAIIESDIAMVQGIFGVAGEVNGLIHLACQTHDQDLTPDLITDDMKDKIIVGGARVTGEALAQAKKVGAAAVVTGGMDDQDLKSFLGYDLGVAITGSEKVGLTVIITEGFGDIAMANRTYDLLKQHEGQTASVNGATQIRAGVIRPEILIPLIGDQSQIAEQAHTTGELLSGRPVRIIRDPYFGIIGQIDSLPNEPQELESGAKTRVCLVKLDDGQLLTIPRANIEMIET